MDKTIRCYLSHAIRGRDGEKATQETMKKNNELAKHVGMVLRENFFEWQSLDGMPNIELYVPADHDEVILLLFEKGYITVKQILEADCAIVRQCKLLLVYGDYFSSGMLEELRCAEINEIPIISFIKLDKVTLKAIHFMLLNIWKRLFSRGNI